MVNSIPKGLKCLKSQNKRARERGGERKILENCTATPNKRDCLSTIGMLYCLTWNNRVTGWLTSILHRMGVVLMDNHHFDFKDLMAFGMFILALLTFVFSFIR